MESDLIKPGLHSIIGPQLRGSLRRFAARNATRLVLISRTRLWSTGEYVRDFESFGRSQ